MKIENWKLKISIDSSKSRTFANNFIVKTYNVFQSSMFKTFSSLISIAYEEIFKISPQIMIIWTFDIILW